VQRDVISSIAVFGAPLLVGVLLLCRIINGHWGSVAFVAIIFAIAFVLYVRFVPLDDLDDEVSISGTASPSRNDEESRSTGHPTQCGR
jgi:hypothetical protein